MISVGALTPSSTGSGPDSSSSAINSLLGRPVSAAFRYSAHSSAVNRPQSGSPAGESDRTPVPLKSSAAQRCLKTPGPPAGTTSASDEAPPTTWYCGKSA